MNRGPRLERRRTREEWVYGLNPVLEAIKSGRQVKSVFLSSSRREGVAGIEREVLSRGIALKKADQSFFDSRFSKGHQGIAAVVAPREYADFDEMLAKTGFGEVSVAPGDHIDAMVVRVGRDYVFLDLGSRAEGLLTSLRGQQN